LIERWNGVEWSAQEAPYPAESKFTYLSGIACTSATVCTAVGSTKNSAGTITSTFAERWNGTSWKIQQSANVAGEALNALSAVSCVSLTVCEAVGSHKPEPAGSTKTDTDGQREARAPSPFTLPTSLLEPPHPA
jgi:hypothetical protein